MYSLIQKIYIIYFTPLPYSIYYNALKNSNLSWSTIGLGLINSQRLFWLSNTCMIIIFYNKNIFLNIFLFALSSVLYITSFIKVMNFLKYLYI
jgi:hypothetical protein